MSEDNPSVKLHHSAEVMPGAVVVLKVQYLQPEAHTWGIKVLLSFSLNPTLPDVCPQPHCFASG